MPIGYMVGGNEERERIPKLWSVCKEAEKQRTRNEESETSSSTHRSSTDMVRVASDNESEELRPNLLPFVHETGNPINTFTAADINQVKTRHRKCSVRSPVWLSRHLPRRQIEMAMGARKREFQKSIETK